MNIAEILKDKPIGTRLYSPIYGDCYMVEVHRNEDIEIKTYYDKNTPIFLFFNKEGIKYLDRCSCISPYGKCMLFPSEKMQDWNKFAWKKGDVLKYNNDSSYLIFEKFTDNSCTTFKWKHFIDFNEEAVFNSEGIACTEDYSLANRRSCGFIHYLDILEKKFHGKFNIDTMKFDKVEPTWKKGDVLVSLDGTTECIFKGYVYDTHKVFIGIHCFNSKTDNKEYIPETLFSTNAFKLQDPKLIPCYINTIEERFNGKLNLETLKIEKAQPEFKDGDIVAVDLWRKNIRIFKEKENGNNICWGKYYIGISFNDDEKPIQTFENYKADCSSDRLATDEEKQQLFSALAKEGKAWDAEKKQIVDLKPKHEFKPFDKVIVRREDNGNIWQANIFSHIVEKGYYACIMGVWSDILPYNEETAKLVGTTKDVKE